MSGWVQRQAHVQMVEHGPAHGLKWTRAILLLTSNVGAEQAPQLALARAQVLPPCSVFSPPACFWAGW